MWEWTGHMGGWWWLMAPLMVTFWALVIWGIVTLMRSGQVGATAAQDAEQLLADRLARGDIDEVTYRRQRALIRS
jgi:putative membrane protein